jgi:hypothetical protein
VPIGRLGRQPDNSTVGMVAARDTEPNKITEEFQDSEALKVAQMTATVATIREDVVAGRLTLDPEAGEEILSMLRGQLIRVDVWLQRARGLARRAPLGENPVGQAMAAKFEHRAGATDDDMSLAGVLTPYRQVLVDAHDAVDHAMRAYQQIEDDSVTVFRKLVAE